MSSSEIQTVSVDEFLISEFDFLVIGGGTAGLAVAARLAESGRFSVGVLEAGQHAHNKDEIDIPAFYGRSLRGEYDWKFETVPQQGLSGRTLPWPRGKALGGTSALNFMTWNRASRDDYDAWEALGNKGWGWDDLLPFFKKSETFHPPDEQTKADYEVSHDQREFGTSGPIQVSYSTAYSASHALWHDTLNSLGVETNKNHVGGSNVGPWTNVNAVDPITSKRCYSINYLTKVTGASRVKILCGATVERVLLHRNETDVKAIGIVFTASGSQQQISASREIILSCGSVKSPQILELSGIGNADVLQTAGIETIVHSPKVGENLQEHLMLALIFEVDPDLANPDDLIADDVAAAQAREQYDRDQSGRLTILPCAICYMPLQKLLSKNVLTSLFQRAGRVGSVTAERREIMQKRLNGEANLGQVEYIFDLGNWSPYFKGEENKKYGTLLQILQYPFSIGSVHITPSAGSSGPTSEDHPAIDPRYYEGNHGDIDFEVMNQSAKFAKLLTSTKPLAGIIQKPSFPSASDLDNEDSLEKWIRDYTITDWHPIGTCAMGGKAGIRDGVVDDRLRVYGVQGLRVIDASIMPLQISSHPQATVYAIAEKGASMILEDHAF